MAKEKKCNSICPCPLPWCPCNTGKVYPQSGGIIPFTFQSKTAINKEHRSLVRRGLTPFQAWQLIALLGSAEVSAVAKGSSGGGRLSDFLVNLRLKGVNI